MSMAGMARRDLSRLVRARSGGVGLGLGSQGTAWRGKSRPGGAWQARRGRSALGSVCSGAARQVWSGLAGRRGLWHGFAGWSRFGAPWLGGARQACLGTARLVTVGLGTARQAGRPGSGSVVRGQSRHGRARQSGRREAGRGGFWRGSRGSAWCSTARLVMARRGSQGPSGPGMSARVAAGQGTHKDFGSAVARRPEW